MAKVFLGAFWVGFFTEGGDFHGFVGGGEVKGGGLSAFDISI